MPRPASRCKPTAPPGVVMTSSLRLKESTQALGSHSTEAKIASFSRLGESNLGLEGGEAAAAVLAFPALLDVSDPSRGRPAASVFLHPVVATDVFRLRITRTWGRLVKYSTKFDVNGTALPRILFPETVLKSGSVGRSPRRKGPLHAASCVLRTTASAATPPCIQVKSAAPCIPSIQVRIVPIFREGARERAKQPFEAHHKPASLNPKTQNQKEADQLATRKTCATAAWAATSLGPASFDKLLQAPAPHRPDPATLHRFPRQLDF